MFEIITAELGLDGLTPMRAALYFGLLLGLVYGVAAQISRFCLRRALIGGTAKERHAAGAVWLMALLTAILATQALLAFTPLDLAGQRFLTQDIPVLGLLLGGGLFGVGMVLTRGCAGRSTVLGASGNLRALSVVIVFAIFVMATMRGILAPVRVSLTSYTLPAPNGSWPLSLWPVFAIIGLFAVYFIATTLRRQRGKLARDLALGGVIGLLVALGWLGNGLLLQDEFDPVAVESLAFTLPWSESLFYSIAATALQPGFGVGIVLGVIFGAGLSALLRKEFRFESFTSPAQTGRYILGAALMGFGGVLAGGCSIGAGLSGVSTLSLSATLALSAIIAGAKAAGAILEPRDMKRKALHMRATTA